ncbi:phosphopantetheine-binding protein, partial [Streptomyces sp. KLOTTS4A1]|uniref:phosphopantetheine-binding protein n=1 Tax=Streptomyces sp. KLOTTS4A1 TaxID=3390996 RepID=UPI0039F5F921
ATSIAWGPWAGGGLVTSDGEDMLARRGLPVMDPQYALTALAQAVTAAETTIAVADVDWDRFTPAFTALRPSPLLADLPDTHPTNHGGPDDGTSARTDGGEPDPAAALRQRLASAAGADGGEAAKAEILLDLVRGETARVLGIANPAQIKARRGFMEIGFDSLLAVELRNGLSEQTGLKLPATLVFDFPAPEDLVRHLRELFAELFAEPIAEPIAEQFGDGRTRPGPTTALAEIDRLERVLESLSSQGVDGADITGRLEALLSRWNATQEASSTTTEPEIDDLLDAATPDEMFELIQREFGKS